MAFATIHAHLDDLENTYSVLYSRVETLYGILHMPLEEEEETKDTVTEKPLNRLDELSKQVYELNQNFGRISRLLGLLADTMEPNIGIEIPPPATATPHFVQPAFDPTPKTRRLTPDEQDFKNYLDANPKIAEEVKRNPRPVSDLVKEYALKRLEENDVKTPDKPVKYTDHPEKDDPAIPSEDVPVDYNF